MDPTLFAEFFKVEQIPKNSDIFHELQNDNIRYFYFKKNKDYYLFFYGETKLHQSKDNIYQKITVIKELNTKYRKIRSLRGFLIYALEINKSQPKTEILTTNFSSCSLFWSRLENILRQNRKDLLLNFLSQTLALAHSNQNTVEENIKDIQNQINDIKQEIKELYNLPTNPRSISVNNTIPFKTTDNLDNKENSDDFVPLNQISKDEQIEIIKKGIQLNKKKKINLHQYYEGKSENSVFYLKGYRIKYQTIRRKKLYKELRDQYLKT